MKVKGFVRGGALGALKGKEADQVSVLPFPSTHPWPLLSLPPPWLISFASLPLGSPHFRIVIKAALWHCLAFKMQRLNSACLGIP